MRLTFVLSSLTLSGGVLLITDYANRLEQRGHTIAVVYPRGAFTENMAAALSPGIQQIQASVSLEQVRSPGGKMRLSTSLAKAIPPSDIVVATHTPTVLPVQLAARGLQRSRRAWLYMDYDEMFRSRPLERVLLHKAPRCFDLIMTISQPLAETARLDGARNVVVTGAGLARADLFRPAPRAVETHNPQRIFYLGDTRPRKGLQEVLEAVRLLSRTTPGVQLVIASKQEIVLPPDLPCELHVQPSDEELAALYQGSQVFVSASWGEGLGYPPLEAMACGIPTVIADSVGVRDYARHAENCLLVPPRNAGELAKGIQRLLADPQLSERLVQAGLQTAARYDWEAVIDRCEQALLSLL